MSRVSKEEYEALASFRRALRKYLRFVEEGTREVGLTPQQYLVLLSIKGEPERDWLSIGELADALQLKHHAIVGLVDRCQNSGLVRRFADPKDRRVVRVSLTEEGENALEALAGRNLDQLRALSSLVIDLQAILST